MGGPARPNIVLVWLREVRAPFFTASVVPVVVGTAAGFSATREFRPALAGLALAGTVLLHAGANVANDYFDHVSGSDAANRTPTPFSGGSRVIQEGLLTPRAVLGGACTLWAMGAAAVLALAALTNSLFILVLGLVGLLGGYLYTAPPARLGYRGAGEGVVALLFGVLPVAGAFYVQTGFFAAWTLVPGALVGILIALVLFANEFPDEEADRATGKRTLVVLLGRERAARLYFVLLPAAYLVAVVAAAKMPQMLFGGFLFTATLPLAILTFRFAAVELTKTGTGEGTGALSPGTGTFSPPGEKVPVPFFGDKAPVPSPPRSHSSSHVANFLTIALHLIAGLSLAAGFVIYGLKR